MKKKILVSTLFLICIVVLSSANVVNANGNYYPWWYHVIDTESSDVDGSPNIGSAIGDFNDTQAYDGVFENITEQYVDFSQEVMRGRNVVFGSGMKRGDFPISFPRADRKVATWFNVPNDFTVHNMSFYGRTRYSGESWNVSMGIYNGTWSASDSDAHPTNLVAQTDTVLVTYNAQYWNFTFTTQPTLEGGHRYWFTVHFDNAISIWRSPFLLMNYNKSAKCQDLFSDGLDTPFDNYDPHEWNKYGGFFAIRAHGNETVQNYQLDWEYQFQTVNPDYDYYSLQIYGYTSSEEVQIQVWDPIDLEWDYWGGPMYPDYWKLNATPRWSVSALFQHINETITIRFKGSDESASDQTQDTVFIDAIFLYAYNTSMSITDPVELTLEDPYNAGYDGFVEFDQSPITVRVDTGANWNLHYKGGTFTTPNYVWISNSSDSADAVPLIVWGISDPLFTSNQPRGNGTNIIDVWVFVYVPLQDPVDAADGLYETYLYLSVSTDLVAEPLSPIGVNPDPSTPPPTWDRYDQIDVTFTVEYNNFFYEVFLSVGMWGYFGPIGLVIAGYFIGCKNSPLGVLWFTIECLFAAQYFLLVAATPDYWWHIFILLFGGLFTCVLPLWDRR